MTSTLIVTSVEGLQSQINKAVLERNTSLGVYISLNKAQKSAEDALKKAGVNVKNVFFIDCVVTDKTRDDVLHIKPTELNDLSYAIAAFVKELGKGNKYIIIDSLATLLVYNNTKKVAQFVKKVTEYASQNNIDVIALTQGTTGENLLNTIFNFFDTVKK